MDCGLRTQFSCSKLVWKTVLFLATEITHPEGIVVRFDFPRDLSRFFPPVVVAQRYSNPRRAVGSSFSFIPWKVDWHSISPEWPEEM